MRSAHAILSTTTTAFVACALVLAVPVVAPAQRATQCPDAMVPIDASACVDRYEASLRVVLRPGVTAAWPPTDTPAPGRSYVAVSRRAVLPQGYISQTQARAACTAAGKRLCAEDEWERACRGPSATTYPYGELRERGRCNDGRSTPMRRLFAGNGFHFALMNDPRLNALPGTLARTGRFAGCTNALGVFDMVGNLHEWVATTDGRHGVMRGGYYADATINGRGCRYATRAHASVYHDYSTGFRCCADAVAPP